MLACGKLTTLKGSVLDPEVCVAQTSKRLVYIEDEQEMIDLVRLILGRRGYEVTGANVLVGGTGRSFVLQPVSVEGQVGVNIAGGVTTVTLEAAP